MEARARALSLGLLEQSLRAVFFLPGCNPSLALCCEQSGNQQLSGPPGAGVLPATNQLAGERSEPKS